MKMWSCFTNSRTTFSCSRFRQLRQKIDLKERTVRVYDDVAIVLSRENSDIVQNGQQVGGDMRLTRVYKKFGNEWRVIATHGSLVK